MGADYLVVIWEEQGKAPDNVTAKARGAGANGITTRCTRSGLPAEPDRLMRCNGTGM